MEKRLGQLRQAGYGPEEAARYLGISRATVYNLLRSGALKSVKINRRRIITVEACDELLESGTAA